MTAALAANTRCVYISGEEAVDQVRLRAERLGLASAPVDLAAATKLCRIAEAAGFDSVIAVDHVLFPHAYTSVYPYAPGGRLPGGPGSPLPDPLIWIAAMAAVTTKLRFMTGVIILPLRHPAVLAKQVATLDYMSGGRIELGIGVGWLKEEFEAMGIPFEKRGARSDEYIAIMRKLWAGDGVSHDGPFLKFAEVSSNPKPVRRAVPIVIGGHSEAAARRAGRLGDGFFPSIGAQVDTVPLFDVMRRAGTQFALLQVQSTYPAPFKDVNLRYMDRLAELGTRPVGRNEHDPDDAPRRTFGI